MRARGRTLGALTLITRAPGRSYGADDFAVAQDLAGMTALAIDNARLTREVEESADAARVLTYVADGVVLVDQTGTSASGTRPRWRSRGWRPTRCWAGQPGTLSPAGRRSPTESPSAPRPSPCSPRLSAGDLARRALDLDLRRHFGGIVYAFRDVTDARRLEELKADFVATASHELRTPLAAVYGAAWGLAPRLRLDEAGRNRFVS